MFVFFFLLNYMSSLYILHINPLSDIWFTNIFSHSIGYLFIVLAVPLTNFCFCCLYFWCHIQKISARPMSRNFSTVFSTRSFTVSAFMFKSLIHFSRFLPFVSIHLFFSLKSTHSRNVFWNRKPEVKTKYPANYESWNFSWMLPVYLIANAY